MVAAVAIEDPKAIEAFAVAWGEAWNAHDGDAVAALCAEDLVYDEPALGDTRYGRDAISDFVKRMSNAYPDYVFTLDGLYGDLNKRSILVAWRCTGTRTGTDLKIDFHGDDRLALDDDGLIAAYRCLYDHDLVLRQLRGATSL
jgi:steroid delta-isomerase-like uncharacterized protein